jgi:hypothetical protein
VLLSWTCATAEPIVYTGTAVTSGKIGDIAFHDALVSIALRGDTRNVQPFVFLNGVLIKGQGCGAAPHAGPALACGFINDVGTATVSVRIGDDTIEATFEPSAMIFVSFDVQNGGIGFGRYYQGSPIPPYPLSFKNGNICAVADIQYNHATGYSARLTALLTDLKNGTRLSGDAIACDNPNGNCTDPTTNPGALVLATDHGPFYLTNPYVDPSGRILGEGFFSSVLAHRRWYQDDRDQRIDITR